MVVFPRLGGRDDHGPLTLAHGTEEVDDAVGHVRLARVEPAALQLELFAGVHGAQTVEVRSAGRAVGGQSVDQIQEAQRGTLSVARPPPDDTRQLVAGAESESVDEAGPDVDVVLPGHVPVGGAANEAGAAGEHLEDAEEFARLPVTAPYRVLVLVRRAPPAARTTPTPPGPPGTSVRRLLGPCLVSRPGQPRARGAVSGAGSLGSCGAAAAVWSTSADADSVAALFRACGVIGCSVIGHGRCTFQKNAFQLERSYGPRRACWFP